MGYLKQGEVNANGKRSKKPKTAKSEDCRTQAALADPNPVADAIDGLASIVSTYVTQARNGDNGHSLYTTPNGYPVKVDVESTTPVKLTLADNDEHDTMDRLVAAIERIADSLAKLAGLSRPRLERWYEQEEYEPRHKSIACDGGAPGPAATDGEG